MKLTDEEVNDLYGPFEAAYKKANGFYTGIYAGIKAILELLPSPPAATLRPIAEMPEEVPEGFLRAWFFYSIDEREPIACGKRFPRVNYFIDIKLPTEPDTERARFEARFPKLNHEKFPSGNYKSSATEYVYEGWQARGEVKA